MSWKDTMLYSDYKKAKKAVKVVGKEMRRVKKEIRPVYTAKSKKVKAARTLKDAFELIPIKRSKKKGFLEL